MENNDQLKIYPICGLILALSFLLLNHSYPYIDTTERWATVYFLKTTAASYLFILVPGLVCTIDWELRNGTLGKHRQTSCNPAQTVIWDTEMICFCSEMVWWGAFCYNLENRPFQAKRKCCFNFRPLSLAYRERQAGICRSQKRQHQIPAMTKEDLPNDKNINPHTDQNWPRQTSLVSLQHGGPAGLITSGQRFINWFLIDSQIE